MTNLVLFGYILPLIVSVVFSYRLIKADLKSGEHFTVVALIQFILFTLTPLNWFLIIFCFIHTDATDAVFGKSLSTFSKIFNKVLIKGERK